MTLLPRLRPLSPLSVTKRVRGQSLTYPSSAGGALEFPGRRCSHTSSTSFSCPLAVIVGTFAVPLGCRRQRYPFGEHGIRAFSPFDRCAGRRARDPAANRTVRATPPRSDNAGHGEVDFPDFAAAAYLRLNHHEVYEALPGWTPQLRKGLSADPARGALTEDEWQRRIDGVSRRDNTTGAWAAVRFLFPGLRSSVNPTTATGCIRSNRLAF